MPGGLTKSYETHESGDYRQGIQTTVNTPEPSNSATCQEIETGSKSDSLSTGVAIMLGMTIAQRGVGFLRTALFCRLLPEHELGQWSLVFSFVMLCAPMSLLGITGSFGRYVEHYLKLGHVKAFFQRTGVVVFGLMCFTLTMMLCFQDQVSWLLFGSTEHSNLLLPALLTLATTIVNYYFAEVLIALRRIKDGSIMELISSWTFAVVSIALLACTDLGSYGVILGFATGNLVGAAYGFYLMKCQWATLPDSGTSFTHLSLWQRVAPFAIGLWLVNIATNLFDMVDRYMIVHFSGFPATEAQGMVGQYFSSMAVPILLVGLSTTLTHRVMPYLSEDWEAGRFEEVSDRVNLCTKMIGIMLALGSTVIMIIAPWMFDVVFGGKYNAGLAVLPLTIAFCYWKAISTSIYNFLYCVERTRLMCCSLILGLTVNIVLNAVLLPRIGLLGAAIATAAGCGINCATVHFFSVRNGYRMCAGTLWVLSFPFALPLGAATTAAALLVLIGVTAFTTWLFTTEEKHQIEDVVRGLLQKVATLRAGFPASSNSTQ